MGYDGSDTRLVVGRADLAPLPLLATPGHRGATDDDRHGADGARPW